MPACRVVSGVMASHVHLPSAPSSARRARTVAVGLIAAAMALGMVAAAGAPAHAAPGDTRTGTIAELIAEVPVAPPLYVGYRGVEQFIPKAVAMKKDSRGCNLRQQTIIALATVKPKVRSKCRMSGGTWVINGGTTTVKSPKGLLVQPVIDYKTAWGQGAYNWTPAQRLAWATNVGPTSSLRGKAVNVQATQTLLTKQWADASTIVDEVKANISTGLAGDLSLEIGCSNPFCKLFAAYTHSLQTVENIALAKGICGNLASATSNLIAWGLSVEDPVSEAITRASGRCSESYTVDNETKKFGIVPVVATSATPATYVAPLLSPLPLFTGYPTTAPEGVKSSQAFGLMAPIDWAAPTVPWGFTRVWDSGASWRQVERSKGVYDWSKMDAIIRRAQSTGSAVMYVLGDTPGWANGGKSGATPPTKASDAADFIAAMCSKYGGSVAMYEAWNEGNIVDFWSGSAAELADLTAAVKQAVKDCGSGAKVLASSAGARASGGMATRYSPYLDELKTRGWPVDGFSVHSYPKASGTPVDRIQIIQQWKAMLSGKGAPDGLLYDTEVNYGMGGMGESQVPIGDAKGADWLMQTYIQSQQYGLDGTSWFVWTGAGTDDKVGIQMNTTSAEVNQAWTTVRGWLDGSRMQRCAQLDRLYGCQLTKADGKNATVLWSVDGTLVVTPVGTMGSTLCTTAGCSSSTGTTVTVGGRPILLQ